MGLLENKSYMAQDFYNEYLQLKIDIPQLMKARDFYISRKREIGASDYQSDIDAKVERLHFVLNQLETVHGISMKDLILLSIGVDI